MNAETAPSQERELLPSEIFYVVDRLWDIICDQNELPLSANPDYAVLEKTLKQNLDQCVATLFPLVRKRVGDESLQAAQALFRLGQIFPGKEFDQALVLQMTNRASVEEAFRKGLSSRGMLKDPDRMGLIDALKSLFKR